MSRTLNRQTFMPFSEIIYLFYRNFVTAALLRFFYQFTMIRFLFSIKGKISSIEECWEPIKVADLRFEIAILAVREQHFNNWVQLYSSEIFYSIYPYIT